MERLLVLVLAASLLLAFPVFAQDQDQQNQNQEQQNTASPASPTQTTTPQQDMNSNQDRPATDNTRQTAAPDNTAMQHLTPGQKAKVEGVIVKRNPDSMIVRTSTGGDVMVVMNDATKVEERKSNPFRGSKKYNVTQLMRGLPIEAEGRADSSGALTASKIKFTQTEFKVAQSVESRVTPVEGRVQSAETRLSESEQNAQRLAGQIEELNVVSNAARGGAKAAQQTADLAITGLHTTNDRISALDDYEARKSATIQFKVGSAKLGADAKQQLDELAAQAKNEKGYVIEVAGFASADGSENFNRMLSRRRAEAVVDYLEENHQIPLRRITMPFGYGEKNPVADNKTRDGREQNRRVEVTVLVSKGLTTPPALPDRSSSTAAPTSNSSTDNTADQSPRPR